MINVILAGNAVTAEILYGYLLLDDRYNVVAMTVDDEFIDISTIKDLKSIPLSQIQDAHKPSNCSVIMAMGYKDLNFSRESMFSRLKEMGYKIETYIHPDAKIFTKVPLGEGCVIMPSVVVEPNVVVGSNTMVWSNVILAHHSNIAENCWIASGAVIAGQVVIGRNTFVGVNVTIVDSIIIGEHCIIGAGALVTKNTKPHSVHLARSAEEFRCSSSDYINYIGI